MVRREDKAMKRNADIGLLTAPSKLPGIKLPTKVYSRMDIAYAMGQTAGTAGGGAAGGGLFGPMVPIIIMLAIMWFLLIRPQQKKQKEHREMINNLKKGDMIITTGGLYGRITGITESTLTV